MTSRVRPIVVLLLNVLNQNRTIHFRYKHLIFILWIIDYLSKDFVITIRTFRTFQFELNCI